MSSDGAHALTIIAFVGSVFSPYYALARRRGRGDPANHVAMNVALYGKPHRWAMTERGRGSLQRDAERIGIGASAMLWDGEALHITIDETTVPLPSSLRGRVTVRPRSLSQRRFTLDTAGRHRWQPIGPLSDVTVTFEKPALSWQGTGYFDTNDGDEPLETTFRSWTWSRFDLGSNARIFYDVTEHDGTSRRLALRTGESGTVDATQTPRKMLPRTRWGITREIPCEDGGEPRLLHTMESAPFYTRSAIRSRVGGTEVTGVHENLSLERLVSPAVRLMVPFRMFRRGW